MIIKTSGAVVSTSSHQYKALYALYTLLTTYGWTSLGESNGSVGGMGVTGLFSQESDMNSIRTWFVLRSPDFQRQILISIEGLATRVGYRYSRSAGYVGGDATTRPTASDEFVLQSSVTLGTATWTMAMDIEYPYGWWAHGPSRMLSMIPLNVLQDTDEDPYVYHYLHSDNFFLTKCWHPDNVTQITFSQNANFGAIWPYSLSTAWGGGPQDDSGHSIILPTIWMSRAASFNLFKGFSTFMQCTGLFEGLMSDYEQLNSCSLIHLNRAILPWSP